MQKQPKYLRLEKSLFFADGRSARPVPEGVIPMGEPAASAALETGEASGSFAAQIPMPVTPALLNRGEDRFNIYCSPCHGRTGNGDGMIARRGFKQPADLTAARVRNAPAGYIFQVITNGYGAMADYSYQIPDVRDRWAIVAYIRALELRSSAGLDDVPAAERSKLESQK